MRPFQHTEGVEKREGSEWKSTVIVNFKTFRGNQNPVL